MEKENLKRYFDDVCGYDNIKEELIYLCDIMRNPEPYRQLGARIPRNVMLAGAPGVGKTLMSECLIKASGRKAFRVRKSDDDRNFIETLKETFARARKEAPSIVFLDDMDKYSGRHYGQSTEEATVQACIDDMRDEEVFVIATVNESLGISRSLRRHGRFDRNLDIAVPDRDSSRQIIKRYFSETRTISDSIDIEDVVELTGGMTAVEIKTLANEAGVYAGFDRSDVITMDHIVRAYVSRMDNNRRDNKTDDEEYTRLSACHEAGHAVIAELLDKGSVGLVFAGHEAGRSEGFMSRARRDAVTGADPYRPLILTALGGRAAVELMSGTSDRGAGNDLRKAIGLIRTELTSLCTEDIRLADFNASYAEPSKARTNKIDRRVRERLREYYTEAYGMLEQNRPLLEMMASELEAKGYLLGADVRMICREAELARTPDDAEMRKADLAGEKYEMRRADPAGEKYEMRRADPVSERFDMKKADPVSEELIIGRADSGRIA